MKKWFTLIELVVVVALVVILSSIAFISYENNIIDSRDATRMSDITNLKIALNTAKQKNWDYPGPSSSFNVTNSWVVEVYQWIIDNNISLNTLQDIPKDPKNSSNYIYSISANKQFFQIWLTLENGWSPIAKVDWEYKTAAINLFPSLLLAKTWSSSVEIATWITDWSTNRMRFIVDWWHYNLPYSLTDWTSISTAISYSWIINEIWTTISKDTVSRSCADIYNNDKYLWTWEYQIQAGSWNIININCDCTSWLNISSC